MAEQAAHLLYLPRLFVPRSHQGPAPASWGPALHASLIRPSLPCSDVTVHETLLPRYPDGWEAVWDEGLGIIQNMRTGKVMATVAIAEKGQQFANVVVNAVGGHSSSPPDDKVRSAAAGAASVHLVPVPMALCCACLSAVPVIKRSACQQLRDRAAGPSHALQAKQTSRMRSHLAQPTLQAHTHKRHCLPSACSPPSVGHGRHPGPSAVRPQQCVPSRPGKHVGIEAAWLHA